MDAYDCSGVFCCDIKWYFNITDFCKTDKADKTLKQALFKSNFLQSSCKNYTSWKFLFQTSASSIFVSRLYGKEPTFMIRRKLHSLKFISLIDGNKCLLKCILLAQSSPFFLIKCNFFSDRSTFYYITWIGLKNIILNENESAGT